MTKEQLLKKLETFSSLEEDWDTYGSKPIDSECIDRAKDIIKLLPEEDIGICVFPLNHGGISFEIDNHETEIEFAEIEIIPKDKIIEFTAAGDNSTITMLLVAMARQIQ